jgi:predicted DNA-binding WGR domain protein
MKWILVKKSDGNRGNAGMKKIYEIVLDNNKVLTQWGKAEEVAPQATQEKVFFYPFLAKAYAFEKVEEKKAKGYELILVA